MHNPVKLATLGAQSRETGNIGCTIQRNWQHWVHKTQVKDKQIKTNTTQKTKQMNNSKMLETTTETYTKTQ